MKFEKILYKLICDNLLYNQLLDKPQKVLKALVDDNWKSLAIDLVTKYGSKKELTTLKRAIEHSL